jgi:hypothetical protein
VKRMERARIESIEPHRAVYDRVRVLSTSVHKRKCLRRVAHLIHDQSSFEYSEYYVKQVLSTDRMCVVLPEEVKLCSLLQYSVGVRSSRAQ